MHYYDELPQTLDSEISALFNQKTSLDDWCGYPEVPDETPISYRGVSYYNKSKINEAKALTASRAKFKILSWSTMKDFTKEDAKAYIDSLRPPIYQIKKALLKKGYSQLEVDFIVTADSYPYLQQVCLTKKQYAALSKLINEL